MEFETAQALARLGMIPTKSNDYGQDFGVRDEGEEAADMGASLRDTSPDFIDRIKSGIGIGSVPGYRKGKGPQRLLDQGELNLGRLAEVAPNSKSGFIGIPVRLLDLRSESQLAQFATVTFSILPVNEGSGGVSGGPIVGIVEFGNGSGVSRVEIDVRRGYSPYNGGDITPSWDDVGTPEKVVISPYSCSAVSVPGSSIRVYARNDARFQPYPVPSSQELNGILDPMKVMAHVSYGSRPAVAGATRTIWLAKRGATPVNPAREYTTGIPPLARSFYVLRVDESISPPVMPAIQIGTFGTSATPLSYVTVPFGTDSPVFPLSGDVEDIAVNFPGGPLANTSLAVVFNIGV
jgi:hypothetical protein